MMVVYSTFVKKLFHILFYNLDECKIYPEYENMSNLCKDELSQLECLINEKTKPLLNKKQDLSEEELQLLARAFEIITKIEQAYREKV